MDGRTPYVAGGRALPPAEDGWGNPLGKAGGQIRWQWRQRTNDGDVIHGRIQNME